MEDLLAQIWKHETSMLKLLSPLGLINSEPACGRQAAWDR